MAKDLPKFEGDILDIGNDYYLVKKSVVLDWANQMDNLKKDVENLKVKPVQKKTGVVAGKEGRNEVLNLEQKGQILELRNRGYSLRQIAEVFGVSHETIRQVKISSLTDEQKRLIHQQKREGWSVMQCCESLWDMGHENVEFEDVQNVYDEQLPPARISSDALSSSNVFGDKSISSDFRKRD